MGAVLELDDGAFPDGDPLVAGLLDGRPIECRRGGRRPRSAIEDVVGEPVGRAMSESPR